jgi:SagB-type dehydrogenase family enzyme
MYHYHKFFKNDMQMYLNVRSLFPSIAAIALLALFFLPLARGKEAEKELSPGGRFHHETSLTWRGVIGDVFRSKPKKPPQYKNYPDAKVIKLPKPACRGIPLEEAIGKRRSVRNYSRMSLTMSQLSQLLFSAQGITGKLYDQPLRTAPSAGALYPIEVYVIANDVEGLPCGIYHYAVMNHSLELIKSGDFRKEITAAGLEQEMLGDADVTFVLSAIFGRVCHKYGERGFRYAYIEAGHISQNIYLQAVSLGLGSVSVGAFLDEEINNLIGVDGRTEAVIYLHAVGTL